MFELGSVSQWSSHEKAEAQGAPHALDGIGCPEDYDLRWRPEAEEILMTKSARGQTVHRGSPSWRC